MSMRELGKVVIIELWSLIEMRELDEVVMIEYWSQLRCGSLAKW